MGKLSDVTVEVNARLGVDRRTAETCLRLVEIFCNDNDMCIEARHEENGEFTFDFACRTVPNISPDAFAAINAIGRKTHREV